jgi:hypothetical protein
LTKLIEISVDVGVKWHGFLTKLIEISIDVVPIIMYVMTKWSYSLDDMMQNGN